VWANGKKDSEGESGVFRRKEGGDWSKSKKKEALRFGRKIHSQETIFMPMGRARE